MTQRSDSPSPASTTVEVQDLCLSAGERVLLRNVSARFEAGEVTLIVGPSGAGKSMLLRVLAGILDPGSHEVQATGRLRFGERTIDAASPDRPPVGVVFQNFALFDELSPADNVRFASAHRATNGRSGPRPSPAELLTELRVPNNVRTASLSGGQRQRLALARTLAYDPAVILYDEPTSGLDVATAEQVAALIHATHATHPQTSIIVTHDYEALSAIADRIYLLDPSTQSLQEIPRAEWPNLWDRFVTCRVNGEPAGESPHNAKVQSPPNRTSSGPLNAIGRFLEATSRTAEQLLTLPLRLVPWWSSPAWGLRTLWHYLRLVAAPSAWLYMAIAGGIVGFVATYFTFRFLPYRQYTEPLFIENVLDALGFAIYRILVPVLCTVLIAARCGAAVASDVGGKVYGQQMDALRTFGVRPERYLLTGILYAFLLGTPLLVGIGFLAARWTSLLVFTATHPELGPFFWQSHFHRELAVPGQWWYAGSGWLLAKVLCCAVGMAWMSYTWGRRPKHSTSDVSRGITSNILWSTLFVLVVHFAFAFYEFE